MWIVGHHCVPRLASLSFSVIHHGAATLRYSAGEELQKFAGSEPHNNKRGGGCHVLATRVQQRSSQRKLLTLPVTMAWTKNPNIANMANLHIARLCAQGHFDDSESAVPSILTATSRL